MTNNIYVIEKINRAGKCVERECYTDKNAAIRGLLRVQKYETEYTIRLISYERNDELGEESKYLEDNEDLPGIDTLDDPEMLDDETLALLDRIRTDRDLRKAYLLGVIATCRTWRRENGF